MSVIVNDEGFVSDDWAHGFFSVQELETQSNSERAAVAVDLSNTTDATTFVGWMDQIDLIRIEFPNSADGRGFSLAQHLRLLGYQGRLRAKGHVLADQYAMARRSGFDEVEISDELAARQTEPQWLARSDWQANDYQQRLSRSA